MLTALRQALVAICSADTELRTIAGRTTSILQPWRDGRLDGQEPRLLYAFTPFRQTPQDNDTRRGRIRFTAVAWGNGAIAKCEELLDRVEALITAGALDEQGVNAAPLLLERDYPGTGDGTSSDGKEGSRGIERADLLIDLEIQQPAPTP